MDKAAGLSISACAFIYTICGTLGYFYDVLLPYKPSTDLSTWGFVNSDALQIFAAQKDVEIARLCIAISVIGSFVNAHFAARVCIVDLLVPDQVQKQRPQHTFHAATVRLRIHEVVA
jgi:hypothetical protein